MKNKNQARKLIAKMRECCPDEKSAQPLKACPTPLCQNLTPLEFCAECYGEQLGELTGNMPDADKLCGLIAHASYVAGDLVGAVE